LEATAKDEADADSDTDADTHTATDADLEADADPGAAGRSGVPCAHCVASQLGEEDNR